MHDYIIIIVATMAMFIIPHDGSCLYYYYSISIILSSNDGSHYYFVVVVRRLGVDVLGAFIHNYTLSIPFMLLIIYLQYMHGRFLLSIIPSCNLSFRMTIIEIIIVIHVER